MIGESPPVSVVIPCYCCAHTVDRAVASVAAQTTKPAEVILVDDASSDGTLKRLRALQAEYGAEWIRIIALEHNQGPAAARNAGWARATHPYVAFLDADDTWHPRKIDIQYGWMDAHPSVALAGHGQVKALAGSDIPLPHRWCVDVVRPYQLLSSNRFPTSTVVVRKEVPFRFEDAKRYSEDYHLWLRIVLSGHPAHFLDLPLAYMHKAPYGEGGLSARLWKMELGELDTYHRLVSEGLLARPLGLLVRLFSLAKYVRRVLLTGMKHS